MGQLDKEKIEKLRIQWKKMWVEQAVDKLRAERIANTDYRELFIEKGTVFRAITNSKTLNFKEILDKHQIINSDRFSAPDPMVGGWSKFIKENIVKNDSSNKSRAVGRSVKEKKARPQQKKRAKGWLNVP